MRPVIIAALFIASLAGCSAGSPAPGQLDGGVAAPLDGGLETTPDGGAGAGADGGAADGGDGGGAAGGADGGAGDSDGGAPPASDGGAVAAGPNALDDVMDGRANADVSQAEPQLRSLLTAMELRYLAYVDWSALTPDRALNDPTVRKAMIAVGMAFSALIRVPDAGPRRVRKDRTCDEVRVGLGISFASIVASLTANAVTRATCVAAAAASATGLGAALWVPCVAAAVVVSIRAMANLHGWVVRAAFENFENCGTDVSSADAYAECRQGCPETQKRCDWGGGYVWLTITSRDCSSSPYGGLSCAPTGQVSYDYCAPGEDCYDLPEPHCAPR